MVGSLIKVDRFTGIVIDAGISPSGELIHKIKWLPRKGQETPLSTTTWINRRLFEPNEFKVLVKCDLYGEEQAGL